MCRDVDGNEEDRRGTVSVFNGPDPVIRVFDDSKQEIDGLALWVSEAIEEGIEPDEIGIFVRSTNELPRARAIVKQASQTPLELSDRVEERDGRISIGTMHLAKGLEFKAVVVMACDDDILPLQDRIESVADEGELDEVYETERHLFYVACTRARDRLLVSGVEPASEFFADLSERMGAAARPTSFGEITSREDLDSNSYCWGLMYLSELTVRNFRQFSEGPMRHPYLVNQRA